MYAFIWVCGAVDEWVVFVISYPDLKRYAVYVILDYDWYEDGSVGWVWVNRGACSDFAAVVLACVTEGDDGYSGDAHL